VNLREVLNAIFYVLATGCQWQALPKDLPPKSTAHHYFASWDWDGALGRIHDSQSAKTAQKGALRSTRRASMRARRSRAASVIS